MFENLEVFKISHAMAVHAGQMQAVAAQNVANADTPDYKALKVIDFASSYDEGDRVGGLETQKATRQTHLNGATSGQLPEPFTDKSSEASPNGNSVSIENEMLKSLNAKRQHDRALAIYKSSMGILRATLSRS